MGNRLQLLPRPSNSGDRVRIRRVISKSAHQARLTHLATESRNINSSQYIACGGGFYERKRRY